MRKCDIKTLSIFLTRTSMFVCPVNKDNIVSFLHGYEAGAQGKCNFTELISQRFETQYKVKRTACGWPHEIEQYAENRDLDWLQGFVFMASEVLNAEVNQGKTKDAQHAKSRGRGKSHR